MFFLFDILAFAPPVPELVEQAIARDTGWHDRAIELGGKRYNIGSANLSTADWRISSPWPAAVLAKLAYDPAHILTPGQGIFPAPGCDD